MYNPQRFKSEDKAEIFELMDRFPFATVITAADGKPEVSHLPLTPKLVGDQIELIGHMAHANPQWRSFTNSQVTVIFHGPHTFVTSAWYAENDVPTWNYIVAHVSGKAELIESTEGIIECLKHLSQHTERHWPSGWDFYIPDDLSGETLQRAIVGFRIKIDNIQYKKKLSQNRNTADYNGILAGLSLRTDDNSKLILAEMKKMGRNS